ncbi:unnamed protein product [Cunninghamella blakesleeana]
MTNQQVDAFTGDIKSVKLLLSLIKPIQFKTTATCNIYDEGFTFTVVDHQCLKAVAFIKRLDFERYRKQDDIEPFNINLNTLVDCLGLLGPSASGTADTCKIRYRGDGSPLEIIREVRESKLSITCKITPLEVDMDSLDITINNREIIQRAIMKADSLLDALSALDKGCKRVTMAFSNSDPCFKLYSEGGSESDILTEYFENTEPVIGFDCGEEGSYSYLYSHLIQCIKALEQAKEVSMKISSDGVLSMLFRLKSNDDAYIEFTVLPPHS